MSKGKKTGGRDFKPGQSGNPAGSIALPPEVKALKKNFGEFLKTGVHEIFQKFLDMPFNQFQDWVKQKSNKATVFEMYMSSCLIKAVKSGDMVTINHLMDRFIGKPRQMVDLSGQVNTGTQLSKEQLKIMAQEIIRKENKNK